MPELPKYGKTIIEDILQIHMELNDYRKDHPKEYREALILYIQEKMRDNQNPKLPLDF